MAKKKRKGKEIKWRNLPGDPYLVIATPTPEEILAFQALPSPPVTEALLEATPEDEENEPA